ncbi:TadE/TadG family type IV pilus assembly protein [Sphingosinicella terrae]|uniref:TadE/TadG family type IV pilus assembly protein n=1 Tax=Sphingosinicella terrae TaxID=2172047 RepID=UPI0013B3C3B7|nr:TadE/TadG family type IV pilus assembly protein [Sphingosinicella terrae]
MRPSGPRKSILRDSSAVSLVEFALSLPVFLTMAVGGAELANYITTHMRVSQVALHIADHGARMGNGTLLAARTISEAHINDVFTGAGLQAGNLGLYANGRVILSNLEPMAIPNTSNRYRITWQRCRGSLGRNSSYGSAGDTNLTGIGPAGRQVVAPDSGATMFVEVVYRYQPLISDEWFPDLDIRQVASMMVRDRRDLTQIFNVEGVPVSSCA